MNPTQYSDNELYIKCKEYGENALVWRRKFLGLLPEVHRRTLYAKKGYASIFEFAAKLAGISADQVRLVLNIEKRFVDKPQLHTLLTSGAVSVNKLARVVSIASKENESFLAEQVRVISQAAVETLVRDEKIANGEYTRHTPQPRLQLDLEMQERLLALQEKGIDINKLLRLLLDKHEAEIVQEKERLAEQETAVPSRYIPKAIRKVIVEEHGTKCAIPTCKREANTIHHTRRYALFSSNDPRYLAPLCKEHHAIAHTIDANYVHQRKAALSSVSG